MARVSKSRHGASNKVAAATQTNNMIMAWQDDPDSGLAAISRPIPNLAKAPLKFRIKGAAVKPGIYQPGTAQFRYWTAAEALRRGGDFWAPLLGVTQWEPGPVLPVGLDEGVDLNAYYNRAELAFFHDTAGGKVVYSGESPDVVCHELGHACLDAHRPELFDAPFIEVGAFHESFGDTSAILSALQLKSVRLAALSGVKQNKTSQLSRLAEQLGWAIRQVAPSAVEPDCLRNAYNQFNYVNPQTLPDSAPATQLSAEAHSFSRVFTGAFYEILSGMLKIRSSSPSEADLAVVARDYARLLMDATSAAPVQPDYFAQVASHIIDADTSRFGGKYRSALVTTFVKRQIIPHAAVEALLAFKGKVPKTAVGVTAVPAGRPQIHKVQLRARDFGLADRPLIVRAPVERKSFLMVSAALLHKYGEPRINIEQATHRFVETLFARKCVDTESGTRKLGAAKRTHQHLRKTHVLIDSPEGLKLVRRLFDCGAAVANLPSNAKALKV